MNGVDRISEALRHIPVGSHDERVLIAFALKSELGSNGFEIWDNWYKDRGNAYDPTESRSVWNSSSPDGTVTIGTLFHVAKSHGWTDSSGFTKPPVEEIAERRKLAQERADKERLETERERKVAASKAREIWRDATTAQVDNPYLLRKKVPPVETLRELEANQVTAILGYPPTSKGDPLTGRLLVVPVKVSDELSTLELIDGEGRKTALKGRGTKAGGYWATGALPDHDGGGSTILVGEGVATVLSAHRATGHVGVAALSSGNLVSVASILRERVPRAIVVVLADLVKATGRADSHALQAARDSAGMLAIPLFPGDRPGSAKDFNDLDVHVGQDAVRLCIAQATLVAPEMSPKLRTIHLGEFLSLKLPPREPILTPWLVKQNLTMIYAWRGVGKTWFTLSLAYAVAAGSKFLGWDALVARRVLYVDGEMPANSLQSRLVHIIRGNEKEALEGNFRLVTPDLQKDGLMPDLSTIAGQEAIDSVVGDAEVLFLDNVSCLVRSGKENEAESWQPISTWLLKHRAAGRTIVFVHHSGKGGHQRGSSKREDILDNVIALRAPKDKDPASGACFEIHFEKSRELHGNVVTPIMAELAVDANGAAWTVSSVESNQIEEIAELASQGMTQTEVAAEVGLSRFQLRRLLANAEGSGKTITFKDGRGGRR